jgi:hypothetical protein
MHITIRGGSTSTKRQWRTAAAAGEDLGMRQQWDGSRGRPVVFQKYAAPERGLRRRPVRVLSWIMFATAALAGGAGLVSGGSAAWSGVAPGAPHDPPAAQWISPRTTSGPAPVAYGATKNMSPSTMATRPSAYDHVDPTRPLGR